jgi:hypothetical protein
VLLVTTVLITPTCLTKVAVAVDAVIKADLTVLFNKVAVDALVIAKDFEIALTMFTVDVLTTDTYFVTALTRVTVDVLITDNNWFVMLPDKEAKGV